MDITFRTLADLLVSRPLTLDVEIEEECCGPFSIKGIELEATVMHLGLRDYVKLSLLLSPSEMLVYQNMFLAWIRESFRNSRFSVVESKLDHAVLLLFSKSFGSEDPFVDALRTARWLGENDTLKFCPAIGIASGTVMAGFTGSGGDARASVFGRPLLVASACAMLNPKVDAASAITFPGNEWDGRSLECVFPPVEYDHPDKGRVRLPSTWKLGELSEADLPGIGRFLLRDIANFIHWMPSVSASDKACEWVRLMRAKGFYRKIN